MNQPLAAIRPYAHNAGLLITRDQTADAAANLERISALTDKTADTINHFKKLARKPAKVLTDVDLATVASDALAILEGRIRNENIVVDNRLAGERHLVKAGAIRLEQVLINIFGNALDAMQGTAQKILTVSAEPSDEGVLLVVTDTGVGIGGEDISQVFDPFFTTKEVGEGLGLGLSISYNIIKDFGGTMRVTSDPGAGTCFRIFLEGHTG